METSNNNSQEFHFFSQLPTELRLAIWRICLPNRVVEIDYPWDEGGVFGPDPPSCKLQQTTNLNRRAPTISRVCHESRLVAFEVGHFRKKDSTLEEVPWISNICVNKTWIDPSRDIIHLNWTPAYSAGYYGDGSALDYLAWTAAKARGGSFMFDYLDNYFDGDVDIGERIGALRKLQNGVIVMRIIVVHTTFENAVKTGLFGLLGDACIQLVDISDETRLNAFFDFAEKCESEPNGYITRRQDFHRETPESVKKLLNDRLTYTFNAQAARTLLLRPAIMFRFCPYWCNHSIGDLRRAEDVANERNGNGMNRGPGGRQSFRAFMESLHPR
ncbi:uncharacterized protein N7473_012930 [Penicillium subrubescens]|uniref:2EXR domain-containing protein n=1 Tax=Penicillium subrubescens TaxID=1316194 RepID=A0A1Q5T6T4_9EURO|nr:uncharacterized protein N7473_012930 [Penicillium subrubescens]KAJ5875583.1 hypothetical protein N7473_012930 [Penicillium subrubescens]OKO95888.1 hypothetical protein PENSUB_10909 [Penicillium subrubescens]